jgi:arsenate reductase (thioredoxin)
VTDGKINVLFVCKDNSIRSVIAHALLNRFSKDRFRVFSCGRQPAAEIHPRTIHMLEAQGLSLEHRQPRSLGEFLGDGAPEMDLVINLCDDSLPRLPGNPVVAHWGISDPMSEGSDTISERIAFRRTFRELENRVMLIALLRHQSREERLVHEAARAQAA